MQSDILHYFNSPVMWVPINRLLYPCSNVPIDLSMYILYIITLSSNAISIEENLSHQQTALSASGITGCMKSVIRILPI